MIRCSLLALLVLPSLCMAQATTKRTAFDRIQDTTLQRKAIEDDLTFRQFLERISKLTSARIRLDSEAWKEDAEKISGTRIRLPEYPERLHAMTALRMAMNKVFSAHEEAEMLWKSDELVLTTPLRAVVEQAYDLSAIAKKAPKSSFASKSGITTDELTSGIGMCKWLANEVELRPFESIRVANGKTLLVRAGWSKQQDIDSLIRLLQRQHDIGVVAEAKLYQVDRDFFDKHVAPLLRHEKDGFPLLANIVSFGSPSLDALLKKTAVAECSETLVLDEKSSILSLHESFARWEKADEPKPKRAKGKVEIQGDIQEDAVGRFPNGRFPNVDIRFSEPEERMALAGVTFFATTSVDASRRFLRIQLDRKIHQPGKLLKFHFGAKGFPSEEIQSAKNESTTTSVVLTLPDGGTFVMPALLRMPSDGDRSPIRVLVASMRIRIEEEERQRGIQTKEKN